jgi:hypothetical protein
MPFYPGPGLGGHCIPIDPFYLSWKAKQSGFEARFIELAGHVNGSMPHFVVDKIGEALNGAQKSVNGSRVLVVGIAYKRDIDDIRESPSLDVMAVLKEKGAVVSYADPFVPTLSARAWPGGYELHSTPLDAATVSGFDCVAILTDHRAVDYKTLVAAAPLIVDTRNTIKQAHPHVFKLGAPRPAATVEPAEPVNETAIVCLGFEGLGGKGGPGSNANRAFFCLRLPSDAGRNSLGKVRVLFVSQLVSQPASRQRDVVVCQHAVFRDVSQEPAAFDEPLGEIAARSHLG